MNSFAKNILKIFLVGLVVTIVRIIGQLSIPAGEQTVLEPSIFAQNGTMPLVFDAAIPDLILRTFIDILAVTVGCLAFSNQRNVNPAEQE